MADQISVHETLNAEGAAIPSITLRAPTIMGTPEGGGDLQPSPSPVPSSPALTAYESSSVTSFEDGVEFACLDDEQRQQMIAEVFVQLEQMVGIPHVKYQFVETKKTIEAYQRQGVNLQRERFHIKFLGNPGTGKTTIARLYAKLLVAMGVLKHPLYTETTGADLVSGGILKAIRLLRSGIIFIDEAYQLVAPHQPGGRQIMDLIHTKMENQRGQLVLIFAGYKKDMEAFTEHNSGLTSKIPDTIHFDDFNSDELLAILKRKINEKFRARMKIEAHPDDVSESRYLRILANRLSRGRGSRGFGNARSVENQLQRISKRQIRRLDSLPKETRDDFMFTCEDIIGPHPSKVKFNSEAWNELQSLIGLDSLKAQCMTLIGLSETNYERELKGLDPAMLSLNAIFMGSPGTGKTTVAELYGRVIADLGLLSDGEVVRKTASHFVGDTLGSSEAQTRGILATTVGKVLIIDEAYGLGSASSGSNSGSGASSQDSFRAGAIDTIVGEVNGAAGEDRCILLLGYEDKLREMFQRSNPGLSSRFNYSSPFRFADFTLNQLIEILDHKMRQRHLKATPEALETARDVLERASLSPEYGNARAVASCLQAAEERHQTRLQATPTADRNYVGQLEPADFDPDYAIKTGGFTGCEQLLQGKVSKSAIKEISRLHKQAFMARWTGTHKFRDVVPTNFIFRGAPGTGKTTAARLMGKLYYDLGFVVANEVIEVSVREFIAPFVGQTRQKTKDQLVRALGKVLIIDNAFQLLKGPFELEALQEIINCLQSDEYARKMVVILVGYSEEMKALIHACPPLAGLFPHEVKFSGLKKKDCMTLLNHELENLNVTAPFLKDSTCDDYQRVERLINALALGPGFANAKDIKALAQTMKTVLFDDFFKKNGSRLSVAHSKDIPKMPDLSKTQATNSITRLISQRKCMKPLPSLISQSEMEYSDDDPRFARAFAYEQLPVMEIRIQQACAIPHRAALSHDEAEMFEDSWEMEQSFQPPRPVMSATILMGSSLMAPSFPAIHTADALQYYRPSHGVDHMHRWVEEIDDNSDDECEGDGHIHPMTPTDTHSDNPYKQDIAVPVEAPHNQDSLTSDVTQILDARDKQFQIATLKDTSEMNQEEEKQYRDMLKRKYPFEEVVAVRTQQALRDLGYCPQGYAWTRPDIYRHTCEGGCHHGYNFPVRDYMHRHDM